MKKQYSSPKHAARELLKTMVLQEAINRARTLYNNSRSDTAKVFWLDTTNMLISIREELKDND